MVVIICLSLFDGISSGQLAFQRADIKINNYYASEIDKYAIQITQNNFPNTIQLGDINNYKEWNLPPIDILIGGSPCFLKGTKIITEIGYKNIEDIEVGDYVLTHKNRFKKVVKIGKNDNSETVILKAQGIFDTIVTKNHPYYVRTMKKQWDKSKRTSEKIFSSPKWKNVSDIKKGDFIGIPILNIEKNDYNLSEEFCWFLGRYIADENIRHDKGKDRINSFYYDFDKKAIEKKVPQLILNLPKNLAQKFLDGYMSGDGCFTNNKFKATSTSKELIMGLQLLIAKIYNARANVECFKRPKTAIVEEQIVNQNDTYSIYFDIKQKKQNHSKIIDDIVWYPIRDIIPYKYDTVYNMEVEDDNSYTANNAIVHNCQGFSFAGKQLNFKDEKSRLFFKFVECLECFKPKYFLLENVKMKKEYEDEISRILKIKPIEINSNLVSAQNRRRLYWTNIPNIILPQDKGIKLKDIVHEYNNDEIDLSQYIVPFDDSLKIMNSEIKKNKIGYFRQDSAANRVYSIHNKAVTLCGEAGGGAAKMGQYLFGCISPERIKKRQNGQRFNDGNKFYTLTAQDKHGILINGYIRKLTPIECERLQTLPDGYTKNGLISDTQRYKCLGNGWTVDVIAWILSFIKN